MKETIDLILVPTDFSELSCQAFPWAALLAQQFDARILIVHVIQERDAFVMTAKPGNPWERVLEREDRAMIEAFRSRMESDITSGTETQTLVEVGVADEKLIEAAQNNKADLIVMATHGRTGLSHALIGSVAEKVVRKAPCPVFTVRPS